MDSKAIYKYCKTLGCCELCCFRYIGVRNPIAYEDAKTFRARYEETEVQSNSKIEKDVNSDVNSELSLKNKSTGISNENDVKIPNKSNIKNKNNVNTSVVSDEKCKNEYLSNTSKEKVNNDMDVSDDSNVKDKNNVKTSIVEDDKCKVKELVIINVNNVTDVSDDSVKDKNYVETSIITDVKCKNEELANKSSFKDNVNNNMDVSDDSNIKDKNTVNFCNEKIEEKRKNTSGLNYNDLTNTEISKDNGSNGTGDNFSEDNNGGPIKRQKLDICCSCLGILQEVTWGKSLEMTKEVLVKKGYQCTTFACGLSSPIAVLVRERSISLRLAKQFPGYVQTCLTPLKEAWKWSFGIKLAAYIDKVLDSGAISPLLITVHVDYIDDLQELEILKVVSPQLFESRSKHRRFVTEFTRRSVEQALNMATLAKLLEAGGALPTVWARPHCAAVTCLHAPYYLGARYIKLSRNLPQSPWILNGERIVPSSVQEIIFAPIAKLYNLTTDEAERRLKFMAAGREDVDVRCLGQGRPFAVEITDPPRDLTPSELEQICEEICKSGDVLVKNFVPITREDLTLLKKGEETKCKKYEALCIKLTHSKNEEVPPDSPVQMTASDFARINSDEHVINIQQKTPIRVLHRRPLLNRTRQILEMKATAVPGHPQLFRMNIQTSAGTYVKEWVHGDLGRTAPALADALEASVDLLALDVTAVMLDWPPGRL